MADNIMPCSEWFISIIYGVDKMEVVLDNQSLKLSKYLHLVYGVKRQTILIGLSKLISNYICKLTKTTKFFDGEITSQKTYEFIISNNME